MYLTKYTYDEEGNRTRRTNSSTSEVTDYEWDYRNRLTKVTEKNSSGTTTQVVEYIYDVFDRRIGKEVDTTSPFTMTDAAIERYVYDDIHTSLASLDGGNVVLDFVDDDASDSTPIALSKRYLHGDVVDQILAQEDVSKTLSDTQRVLWPLVDNLGTVRDLAKQDGTIAVHYTYDAYGNVTSGDTSKTRYLFTGREFDTDTELQYNRARWYDPEVGRWISKDPIGFAAGDVNQYRYVGNGPTNATDPSGLDPPLSPMGPGSHIYDPGYGGKQLPAFVKRPTGVEEGGVFKGFPKLPIPEGTTIVKIEPGSRHDRMAGIAGEWALRVADGDESVQCVFPANSRISERIWNSKHNRLMDTLRTWFVKGANEYSLKEDYTSGIIVVKYETPKRDFVRDVGKILLPTGGDYHIEMLGSFLLQYEATIKPNSNEVCFKGRIYNVLTVESLFRNPINRKPTINGNFSRVYMVIEIEHTRPLRPVPPKR
jgi:RHS repeat-associated protein